MAPTLDVSRIPGTQRIAGRDGNIVNLAAMVHLLRPTIEELAASNVIKQNPNFGFAMAHPGRRWQHHHTWDDPYRLTWFATGWGEQRDRYVANAIRKLRPAQREHYDTLNLREHTSRDSAHGKFYEVVESVEPDGSFAWGDFPYGGAVFVSFGSYQLLGAVSGLSEQEDHAVAGMILNVIGLQLAKTGYKLPSARAGTPAPA